MLLRCKECGRKISDEANVCPYCGCPKETQSNQDIPSYQEKKKLQFKSKMEQSKYALLGAALIIVSIVLFVVPTQIHEELLKDARSEWYFDELNNGTLDDTSREIHERLMEESPEYVSAMSYINALWAPQEKILQAKQIQQDLFEKELEKEIDKLIAPRVSAKEMPFYIFGTISLVGGALIIIKKTRKPVEKASIDVEGIPADTVEIPEDSETPDKQYFLPFSQKGLGTMRDEFLEYLIECGYKTVTPSGKPSTAYDYVNRIDKVCEYEQMTYDTLASNIERIVVEYDVGGSKETLGKASHNAVINALRRFQEFCQRRHTE